MIKISLFINRPPFIYTVRNHGCSVFSHASLFTSAVKAKVFALNERLNRKRRHGGSEGSKSVG